MRKLAFLAAAILGIAGVRAEEGAGTVEYWDCADGKSHTSAKACHELDESVHTLDGGEWYVVSKTRTINHTIAGKWDKTVSHIILRDGVTLTVNGESGHPGIDFRHHATLHVYGQKGQTGTLVANGGANGAGIGTCVTNYEELTAIGSPEPYGGSLEFHGGRIIARGGDYGAGIGGSRGSFGNNVTIYGGEVSATGGCWAAGIGGGADAGHGYYFKFCRDDLTYGATKVWIKAGAKVRAKGGQYAAGIGGGYRGTGGCSGLRMLDGNLSRIEENALIIEGEVWAEGGDGAAGIGGAKGGLSGTCHVVGTTAVVSAFGAPGACGIGWGRDPDPKGENLPFVVRAPWCNTWEGDEPPGRPSGGGKDNYSEFNRNRFICIRTTADTPGPVNYWDAEAGKVKTCSDYRIIGPESELLDADKWYVVHGTVRNTKGLWCGGMQNAHLILKNGSRLEIEAPDNEPGIRVYGNNRLQIYSETEDGNGTLIAVGGLNGAGIGGRVSQESGFLDSGFVTIHGGRITCVGGGYAAGIGGSNNGGGTGGGIGRELTILNGEVTAIGGWGAAGVGGAAFGGGASNIHIDGGSLHAFGGLSNSGWLPGIGCGMHADNPPASTDISTEGANRDFVIWEGTDESTACRYEPPTTAITVSTKPNIGILVGRKERVEYCDGAGVPREAKAEVLIPGVSPVNPLDTTSDRWFVAENDISFTQTLTLPGKTANLILPDDSSLSIAAGSSSSPALRARALNVFGQELGTGVLKVQGGSNASGISTDGAFTLSSGRVVASGARDGLTGGSLAVEGGRLAVSCQQTGLAFSGAVAIRGGQVAVTDGVTHALAGSLTVSGGNLLVDRGKLRQGASPPRNAEGKPLFRLTVVLPDWFGGDDETAVRIADWEGPATYGLNGLHPIGGRLYLWLPNGTYKFNVDCGRLKIPYEVEINGDDAVVNPGDEVFDLAVNGVRIQTEKSGAGWNYQDGVLHLTGKDGTFVISGSSTRGEVQVRIEADMTVVLSKATVVTSRRAAMRLADNVKATVWTVDGVSTLSASGDRNAATGAGLEVDGWYSKVTIEGDGTSTLYATGGWGSAGIGGTSRDGINSRHCGDIDIRSGNVIAIGGENGAGIGGGREGLPFGDIVLECGATVTATGGWGAAGIGGGLGSLEDTAKKYDFARGRIWLEGAVVSAGGGLAAAGIGGGRYIDWRVRKTKRHKHRQSQTPQVNVNGGTIIVSSGAAVTKEGDGTEDGSKPNWNACADIGMGENGWCRAEAGVRIRGGTIFAAHGRIDPGPLARNVYFPARRVSVVDAGLTDGQPVQLVMNEELNYGTRNVYSVDGKIHLYLPDRSLSEKHPTTHSFKVNGISYVAKLNGTDTVAERCKELGDCTVSIAENAPHVSGFVVSNGFGRIDGVPAGDFMDYTVEAYDDVTIGFTVEEGYVREGGTRICLPGIVDGVTIGAADLAVHPFVFDENGSRALVSHGMECVDLGYLATASTRVECVSCPAIEVGPDTDWSRFLEGVATTLNSLKIYEGDTLVMDLVPFGATDGSAVFGLYDTVSRKTFANRSGGAFEIDDWRPIIPYRAWNPSTRRMEDRTCFDYTVVTEKTTAFESNHWYAVTNTVDCGAIAVNGFAHLILCDGAKLTAESLSDGAISGYGQPSGCGGLEVSGEVSASLSCEGGILSAGTLAGETLVVICGTLEADAVGSDRKTIAGGSVKAARIDGGRPGDWTNQPLYCVTAECEGLKVERLALEGLDDYVTNDIYPIDSRVYLWLPNGTHTFALSDGTTTYGYCADVDGADITVSPLPPLEPVVPGEPLGPYETAEEATNAANRAVLVPAEKVLEALGTEEAIGAYCDMFGFAVTGGGTAWSVEAVLKPEPWTNVVLSAQAATRQIPVRDIAKLPLNTPTNVTVTACCVPGFFYSLYSGNTVTNLKAVVDAKGRNVLCGADKEVEFGGVVKPSDAAGFFSVGVLEAPKVLPYADDCLNATNRAFIYSPKSSQLDY